MNFRDFTRYELTAEERLAIAQTIDILTSLKSEIDTRGAKRLIDGKLDIMTISEIYKMVAALQELLSQDEEDIYFE